jgi:hypothetical protein
MGEPTMTQQGQVDLINAILNKPKRRVNRPDDAESGKRLVGWVVDEADAGMSEALFGLEGIEDRLRTLLSSSRGEQGAFADVLAERRRQVEVEGFDAAHDDAHIDGAIARAAAAYAWASAFPDDQRPPTGSPKWFEFRILPKLWQRTGWDRSWWKPTTRRHDLVKSAALAIAEIERLDRADGRPGSVPTSLAGQVPDGWDRIVATLREFSSLRAADGDYWEADAAERAAKEIERIPAENRPMLSASPVPQNGEGEE